jgi:MFS family permease
MAQTMKAPGRAFSINRDFGLLFLVMLMIGAGNTALQSVLPNIGRALHVGDSLIAIIFSVSALLWMLAAPYWARKSDQEGRKRMILIGAGGFTFSIFLVGLALLAGLKGWISAPLAIVGVICARMIYGMFGSAAPPAAQAMIALRTTREERTKALTLLGSAFGLGTIIGPAVAPALLVIPGAGLAGPAFAFGVAGIVCILATFLLLKDQPQLEDNGDARGANVSYPSLGGAPAGASITAATSEPVEEELRLMDPRVWPWMLCGIIMGHAQAMTGQAMGFYVIDQLALPIGTIATQQSMALVFMAGAAAALLVQWGIIPLLDLKPKKMMIWGLVLATLGQIVTANASSLYGIATAYALASIGFGFTRPAFTAGSSLAVGRRLQGKVAGQVTSINGAVFVFGPAIGVALYQVARPLPFLIAGALLIALLPFAWKALKDED